MIWKSYLTSTVRASFHGQQDILTDDHNETKNGASYPSSPTQLSPTSPKKSSKASLTGQLNSRLRYQKRGLRESPTYRLRYVIGLLITFTVASAPSMALFLMEVIDPALDFSPYAVLINVLFQMAFVYMVACPFILIKCLPQVKVAITALLLRVCPLSL